MQPIGAGGETIGGAPSRPGPGFAIVGIGCRFPGGVTTPDAFWELLAGGGDAVTEAPPERFDEALFDADPGRPGTLYARWGGFLDGIDRFDSGFFGMSPREARRVDPQHRLLLEVAWEALEDGGQPPDSLAGSSSGVFVGISGHDYADLQARPEHRSLIDGYVNAGSGASMAANRISYLLDARGPSVAVDTACSSALTALHLAVGSLSTGECDLAVVGAVNALITPEPTIGFCKAGMLSRTGRCRPFDARADGYVRGEGAGAVVLKPLDRAIDDGDRVYAVVLATGVNQDGRTAGISVPNPAAQQALIVEVLRRAGVAPDEVGYVEAHGTGTPVGDPREAQAIGAVMAARPPGRPCPIGSAKGNVGHLEAAAGMVGLVKVALALGRGQIPPSLHFDEPNPEIPFGELRLRVPTALEPWPGEPGDRAFAAVNAFGFGGANAHAVLCSAPPRPPAPTGGGRASALVLSARSPESLGELARAWVHRLGELAGGADVADLCRTAALRRSHHPHRLAVVGATAAELAAPLLAFTEGRSAKGLEVGHARPGPPPPVAFVCSGMGPQWWGMGRELARTEPAFAAVLEECDRHLLPLAGWSLLDALGSGEEDSEVAAPHVAHVANLAIQVALAAVWRSWGVVPDAVVGHSSGEMAAACIAGAVDLPDAVRLAFHRGRLQAAKAGTGGMLAAGLPADAAGALVDGLAHRVCVAAVNSPTSVTFSGDPDALAEIAARLEGAGRMWHRLPVTVPYHGPQLEDLRDDLLAAVGEVHLKPPAIPLVSTVTGTWHDDAPLDGGYWWRNVRSPVRFADAVGCLVDAGYDTYLELAPRPVLAPAVTECLEARGRRGSVLASMQRGESERAVMLRAVGALHVAGRPPAWAAVLGGRARCVSLPPYPWQRERHWVEIGPGPASLAGSDTGHPLLGRRLPVARPTWHADLGDPRLAFLDGHRVQGAPTFPAAGYVELALAAARQTRREGPLAVEGLELLRLLPLDSGRAVSLQCLVGGDGTEVEIHSAHRDDPDAWTKRASARLSPRPPGPPGTVDLDALTAASVPVDVDDAYRAMEAGHGLAYGGLFRSLRGLWRGDGEALGRVEAPPGDPVSGAGWQVHPALLDAAFHVLVAAAAGADGSGSSGVLLPVSIGRVELHAPPGDRFWSRAVVRRRDGAAMDAVVELIDDGGRVAVRCEGLRLRALGDQGTPPSERVGDLVYEERWEPAPRRRPSPVAVDALAGAAGRALDAQAQTHRFGEYYRAVAPALDAMAARFAADALVRLGAGAAPDGAGDEDTARLADGVAPRHRKFLARLVRLSRAAGGRPAPAPAEVAALAAAHPAYAAAVELVAQSGVRLVRTLRGEDDAREWMVAGPWLPTLVEFYHRNPGFRVYAEAVAAAVAAAREANDGGKLRVLEVGGGTGGATLPVLDRLPAGSVDYLFTDVSPYLLKAARERLRDRPDVRTAVLDVEDPAGPDVGLFDVVVAADVVHAAADVRATLGNLLGRLAPGGALVLMEAVSRSPWLDLVFGQLDGWWRHADADLRPEHPLLAPATWTRLLAELGCPAAAVTDDAARGDAEPLHAVVVATSPPPAPVRRAPRRWLVLTDGRGAGPEIAAELRERGDQCVLAWPGPVYRRFGGDGVELAPGGVEEWARLLADVGTVDGVVHLWGLDAPEPDSAADLMAFQETACGSVVALFQALEAAGGEVGTLWLVTAGAQPVDGGDGGGAPGAAQSPLWGLGRVVRTERGAGRCRLVDLGAGAPDADVAALIDELDAGPEGDGEIAFRDGRRLAARLEPAALQPASSARRTGRRSAQDAAFRVAVSRPGALESLVLREVDSAEPGPGQVAVRVRAGALNFRDVLVALGIGFAAGGEDPVETPLGWECAGVVEACGEGVDDVRPGDEVVAMAAGALGSRVVTRAGYVVPKPAGLSFEAAATLPVAFLTADFALNRLARLAAGERVLVHAAAGGVGLAAVQLARRAGAEVLATAGTAEKRAFLRSAGVEHVFDSRTPEFGDGVLDATGGEGVDVVLNSLTGDLVARGLAVLRPHGRFVEIGKRDIHESGRLDLAPFRNNLSYLALDLHPLYEDRPELVSAMLRSVCDDVAAGRLEPLPRHDFDLASAEQAFRLMAQARHIGKVVLTVGSRPYHVVPASVPSRFRGDGTYLVTGGLGGFSLAVAAWMAGEGAGTIVLMSRSGAPRPEDAAALEALTASTAEVVIERGDVTDAGDVRRVVERIRDTTRPLRGVVHAAMVLDDALLGRLDYRRFEAVLAPKLAGAWNLHAATAGHDLDLFVLFSSISAMIGQPAQASYAAGNAFLGGLTALRRAEGQPSVTVDWGVISGAGYVARHGDVERRMARQGLHGMAPDEACAALGAALDAGVGRVVVTRGRWGIGGGGQGAVGPPTGRPAAGAPGPSDLRGRLLALPAPERAGAVEHHVREVAARVLEMAPDRLDVERPLLDLGFDSLMAVELRTIVRTDLGVEVPIAELLDGLDVRRLAATVLAGLERGDGRDG